MRLPLRSLCVSALAFTTSGCFPYGQVDYYRPSAEQGRERPTACGAGVSGVDSVWTIEREGVRASVSAQRAPDSGNSLFKLSVVAKVAVEVALDGPDGEDPVLVVNGEVYRMERAVGRVLGHEPVQSVSGRAFREPILLDEGATLTIEFWYNESQSKEHSVQWPALLIEGERFEIPVVTFRLKRGLAIQYVNC